MSTLTGNKINVAILHIVTDDNLSTDQFAIYLTDTAPTAASTAPTGEISYANFSGSNPNYLTISSSSQTSGAYKLIFSNLTMTASGVVPQWRYIGIKDVTTSTVVCWYDFGSEVNMGSSDTFVLTADTNGQIQISS